MAKLFFSPGHPYQPLRTAWLDLHTIRAAEPLRLNQKQLSSALGLSPCGGHHLIARYIRDGLVALVQVEPSSPSGKRHRHKRGPHGYYAVTEVGLVAIEKGKHASKKLPCRAARTASPNQGPAGVRIPKQA